MARTRKRKKQGSQEFDSSRWAHAVFALFAGIAAWMFGHLVEDVWAVLWARWPADVPRPNQYWSQGIGAVIGIGMMIWVWSRERYFKFVTEVVTEVSQIIWPTRAETRAATVVVVVITLICSGLLALMDTFWTEVTDWIYGL